ncbi:hypothetical protein, partial [Massilia sp. Root418]|uniref:hypothetical protein n=1 Tax=Massilia sp. Root418 TaxID=1736532 RepID=UPI000B224721
AVPGAGGLNLEAPQSVAASQASHTLAGVDRMVSALKQFDAQGPLASGDAKDLAAPGQSNTHGLPGTSSNGFLAIGK